MSVERPMGVLQKASAIVELLATNGPLTPGDIAERLDMPRPSVYRLVEALNQSRLTIATPDSRVKVSERWLRLADAARASMHEWASARSVLDELCRVTGQTTYLSVPSGDQVICVDWAQGRGISVLVLKPGGSLPLYTGAAGRATLAFRPEDPEAYLALAPFPPMTGATLTSAAELRADIHTTRTQGYALSDEDVTEGIGALGVPLIDRSGTLRGTLSLAGLAEEIRGHESALVGHLTTAGAQLVQGLG